MTIATADAPTNKRAVQRSPKKVTIRLELLSRDRAVQSRTQLDQKTVSEYAELIADGAEFPPLVVFDDGESLWVADGFHRAEAAERAGLETFPCEVRPGTRRDAILFAVGANAFHGLRRTIADKRRAVGTLLRDEEWSKWSDREIARLAGVGKTLVLRMRRELKPETVGGPRLARRGKQVYEITRPAPAKPTPTNYIAGWLYYLVRFTPQQFVRWQQIVKERTSTSVLAEAVDVVMRMSGDETGAMRE
ncbi:MAG: ParB N-terminal domain-containing protein [Rubrivivax sp.]|nr:ParB N-terminal domain-containing protein [Pyrinomonadaceae bacterium]